MSLPRSPRCRAIGPPSCSARRPRSRSSGRKATPLARGCVHQKPTWKRWKASTRRTRKVGRYECSRRPGSTGRAGQRGCRGRRARVPASLCAGTGRYFPINICVACQNSQPCSYRHTLFYTHFAIDSGSSRSKGFSFGLIFSGAVTAAVSQPAAEPGADGVASPRGRAGRSGRRGGSARGACVAAVAAELCASAASARVPRILETRHQCQRAPTDAMGVQTTVGRHTAPGRVMPGG